MTKPSTPLTTGCITAIEPSKDDPSVRRIRVDGVIVARLPEAAIERLGLAAEDDWTEAVAASVEAAVSREKARKIALSLLASRGYAPARLIERLESRGITTVDATCVVDQLIEDGWLDESAFASELAESIAGKSPAAPMFIAEKLKARGVAPDLAEDAAQQAIGGRIDDLALQVARDRLGQLDDSLSDQTKARRIAALLARRGFEPMTIESAINALSLDLEPES